MSYLISFYRYSMIGLGPLYCIILFYSYQMQDILKKYNLHRTSFVATFPISGNRFHPKTCSTSSIPKFRQFLSLLLTRGPLQGNHVVRHQVFLLNIQIHLWNLKDMCLSIRYDSDVQQLKDQSSSLNNQGLFSIKFCI